MSKARSRRAIALKKRKCEIGKIKNEIVNFISINARGVAKKKKSIEEIIKNENVDIAIRAEY